MRPVLVCGLCVLAFAVAEPLARAEQPQGEPSFYNPHWVPPKGPKVLDLSPAGQAALRAKVTAADSASAAPAPLRFDELDTVMGPAPDPDPAAKGALPPGWVQRGNTVMPREVAEGLRQVQPPPQHAFIDIPGNKYPRKHTLYLNFVGGMLTETLSGRDNSALGVSVLAKTGIYPAYTGGEQRALAAIQAVEQDLAAYGVRVVFEQPPNPIVPYTMGMVGGSWTDTNIDSPAGGVAPTTDCEALNQRHVVYTFAGGGQSASSVANTTSQEAGHAWGLDHSLNCNSVMAYCGGGDQFFSTTCDTLCETQCQGPNTVGCRIVHEVYCGEDSEQQNEDAELNFVFGTNDPDLEAPTVNIVSPAGDVSVEVGANVDFRAEVDDDYGGVAWKVTVDVDGMVMFDEIDFFRENIDDEFRVALNLQDLATGVYTVTLEAHDHADHVTIESVQVIVGDATPPMGTGDGDTGPVGTSGDMDTGNASAETGDTIGQNDDGGGKGCGCRSDAGGLGGYGGSVAWLLAAFAWRRRRRD